MFCIPIPPVHTGLSSYRVQHLAALCEHCQTYVFIFPNVDFDHWATLYSMFYYQNKDLPYIYHVYFMFHFPRVQHGYSFQQDVYATNYMYVYTVCYHFPCKLQRGLTILYIVTRLLFSNFWGCLVDIRNLQLPL